MPEKPVCIACSIFKRELLRLKREKLFDLSIIFVDSMLHMQPCVLQQKLTRHIREKRAEGRKVILVFGDCSPCMDQMVEAQSVCRTTGQNCFAILLGKTEYKKKIREGVFFLLPEWVVNWREIFKKGLGLEFQDTAQAFMQSMHTGFLYLDTGLQPVPHQALQEISEFCGLPVTIHKVALDDFRESLLQTIAEASG